MLQTNPPSSSLYGGTSVQPPPKSSRVGARAMRAFMTRRSALSSTGGGGEKPNRPSERSEPGVIPSGAPSGAESRNRDYASRGLSIGRLSIPRAPTVVGTRLSLARNDNPARNDI